MELEYQKKFKQSYLILAKTYQQKERIMKLEQVLA